MYYVIIRTFFQVIGYVLQEQKSDGNKEMDTSYDDSTETASKPSSDQNPVKGQASDQNNASLTASDS